MRSNTLLMVEEGSAKKGCTVQLPEDLFNRMTAFIKENDRQGIPPADQLTFIRRAITEYLNYIDLREEADGEPVDIRNPFPAPKDTVMKVVNFRLSSSLYNRMVARLKTNSDLDIWPSEMGGFVRMAVKEYLDKKQEQEEEQKAQAGSRYELGDW